MFKKLLLLFALIALIGCSEEPPKVDTDGDGYSDDVDAFPLNAYEWADTDGDGVGDNNDAFPNDSSESLDIDGDGVGDNADNCPDTPSGEDVDENGCSVG